MQSTPLCKQLSPATEHLTMDTKIYFLLFADGDIFLCYFFWTRNGLCFDLPLTRNIIYRLPQQEVCRLRHLLFGIRRKKLIGIIKVFVVYIPNGILTYLNTTFVRFALADRFLGAAGFVNFNISACFSFRIDQRQYSSVRHETLYFCCSQQRRWYWAAFGWNVVIIVTIITEQK